MANMPIGWNRGINTVQHSGAAFAAGFQNTANNPFLVDIDVSLYGGPCVNPNESAQVPATNYGILNNQGSGCGALGGDDQASKLAEQQSVSAFLFSDNLSQLGSRATMD